MARVREYCQEDYRQLRELALGLHASTHPTADPTGCDTVAFEGFLNHLLGIQAKQEGHLFVAEQDGRLLGFVCLLAPVAAQGVDDGGEAYAFLSDLFVRPDSRRTGVGRLLTDKAERHARHCGAGRVALKVLSDNAPARHFYHDCDYQERFVVMSKQLTAAD